jgi:ABC-2 type transport system ATP-binding protein
MSAIIEGRDLSRWYGLVMGLNHVSFDVRPGLTGLVGPNGAGKSTLIQLITGQLRPNSGTLQVLGETPWNNSRVSGRIGYCPEGEAVHPDLRPTEWLRALGRLSGLSRSDATARAESTLDRVGLAREHWTRTLGQYSKGMRQRVKLAQALLHEPDLLVLDEPMNGLDPMGRQEVAQILLELAHAGRSILISSHILSELEGLCREFLILNWGRILASGSRQEIRTDLRHWSEQFMVRCDAPEHLARVLFDAGVLLGFDLDAEQQTLHLRVKDPEIFFARWLELLHSSGVTVYEIRSQSRSLKQIFERVTT